jgi:hypothetical protein
MSDQGSPGASKPEDAQPAEHLNIKVTDNHNEVFFKIKRTTALKKLMDAFCERQGKPPSSVRFLFDGSRVQQTDSPETVSCSQISSCFHDDEIRPGSQSGLQGLSMTFTSVFFYICWACADTLFSSLICRTEILSRYIRSRSVEAELRQPRRRFMRVSIKDEVRVRKVIRHGGGTP